jgi:hypothetical protein
LPSLRPPPSLPSCSADGSAAAGLAGRPNPPSSAAVGRGAGTLCRVAFKS